MESSERAIVVSVEHRPDARLEKAIQSQGFRVQRASSLAEALSLAAAEPRGCLALFVQAQDASHLRAFLDEAARRVPSAKLIAMLPDGQAHLLDSPAGAEATARLLCLAGDSWSAETAGQVRAFLCGQGYRWASDLEPAPGLSGNVAECLHRDREDEARQLMSFVVETASCTDLETMLRRGLCRCMDIVGCNAGSIYLWDERTGTLVLRAAEGPEQDKRLGLRQKMGEGLAGWVAEVGQPILVTDARKVESLRGRVCRRYDSVSCLAAPITHGEEFFGVICLTMPRDDEPFDADDLRLAHALSEKLGALLRPLGLLSELRSLNDRLLRVLKSYSDLSVKKDAQVEAMRVLSSDILDSIPVGVIAYDRQMRVCFANSTAERMLGLERVGLPGQTGLPLADGLELDADGWRCRLESVLNGSEGFRLERNGYCTNGQRRVLDIQGSCLRDSDGVPIGGILTMQDVTAGVEMEEKLSAVERLALVGQLAAKVAHELNNPLDGILRFVNLAMRQMDRDRERAASYLQESRQGLLRMSNIVHRLLAFSRRRPGAAAAVSLSVVLRDALALYEERARSTNTTIVLDVPPDLPAFESAELCEVFGNVIKNALDAMGQNGELRVKAVRENGCVQVVFSDTGPGVPEEIRDKVFEPFFTTKKDGAGIGLGLATCRDALSRMGGTIRLCPSERGATFEIMLPAAGSGSATNA